ncbi:unnamed protein product [Caenorhabditis angaria]|uniref:Uncharacterized protein n=1 Tax=Caenorhabditis angaria TaxID=860376 RepID=A0A9P1J0U8_9PELO|nr:unnamed protein product [Caenorhabditis angaria]
MSDVEDLEIIEAGEVLEAMKASEAVGDARTVENEEGAAETVGAVQKLETVQAVNQEDMEGSDDSDDSEDSEDSDMEIAKTVVAKETVKALEVKKPVQDSGIVKTMKGEETVVTVAIGQKLETSKTVQAVNQEDMEDSDSSEDSDDSEDSDNSDDSDTSDDEEDVEDEKPGKENKKTLTGESLIDKLFDGLNDEDYEKKYEAQQLIFMYVKLLNNHEEVVPKLVDMLKARPLTYSEIYVLVECIVEIYQYLDIDPVNFFMEEMFDKTPMVSTTRHMILLILTNFGVEDIPDTLLERAEEEKDGRKTLIYLKYLDEFGFSSYADDEETQAKEEEEFKKDVANIYLRVLETHFGDPVLIAQLDELSFFDFYTFASGAYDYMKKNSDKKEEAHFYGWFGMKILLMARRILNRNEPQNLKMEFLAKKYLKIVDQFELMNAIDKIREEKILTNNEIWSVCKEIYDQNAPTNSICKTALQFLLTVYATCHHADLMSYGHPDELEY